MKNFSKEKLRNLSLKKWKTIVYDDVVWEYNHEDRSYENLFKGVKWRKKNSEMVQVKNDEKFIE